METSNINQVSYLVSTHLISLGKRIVLIQIGQCELSELGKAKNFKLFKGQTKTFSLMYPKFTDITLNRATFVTNRFSAAWRNIIHK